MSNKYTTEQYNEFLTRAIRFMKENPNASRAKVALYAGVNASKKNASFQFYKKKVPTYDYLQQLMVQVGNYDSPVLLSREQKYRRIKTMDFHQITDIFRKLCRVDTALCVYEGPKNLNIDWSFV